MPDRPSASPAGTGEGGRDDREGPTDRRGRRGQGGPAGGRADRGPFARLRVGVASHVRAFARTPANVLLLVALPVVVVEGYGATMEAFPQLPFVDAASMVAFGRVNGAVYATAFLSGVLGLFQVISAVQGDERLLRCGFSRTELFASRLATVVAGCLLVAGVSLAALWRTLPPENAVAAFGALGAAALVYGLLGMLVGAVLPRALEGSLVLVFLVDLDDFLSSGLLDLDAAALRLLPLHHPHALFRDAVFEGSVAAGDALATGAYLAVAFLVATGVYVRLTGNGGVGA